MPCVIQERSLGQVPDWSGLRWGESLASGSAGDARLGLLVRCDGFRMSLVGRVHWLGPTAAARIWVAGAALRATSQSREVSPLRTSAAMRGRVDADSACQGGIRVWRPSRRLVRESTNL